MVRLGRGDLAAVFVPVGGGGLLAGVRASMKVLMPEVKVIGVEPVDSDAMSRALAAGKPVEIEDVGLFADSMAVRQVGQHTFPLVRATASEMVRVADDRICAAIKDVLDDTRCGVDQLAPLPLRV